MAVGLYGSAALAPRGDVVALHLLEGEFLLAVGTDVVLLLPYGELNVVGEGAEVEIMFVSCQDIGDDAERLLDVAVTHETGNLLVEGFDVERLLMICIVEICPVETLHDILELLHAEVGGCPIQDVLKICPKDVGIRVMLMTRHIADERLRLSVSCLVSCHPFKSLLEEVLADRSANDQILAQTICSAIRLREMTLGIAHKRTCIYGIVDFLVVERLACYIDCLEPFQFLRLLTFTDINRQLIV